MRVVVTGATGNVGTALLQRLGEDETVEEIIGVARRTPEQRFRRTTFVRADVSRDSLKTLFEGADAVIHLAWALRPSHDIARLDRNNVEGSARVFEAAAEARVPTLIHASSIGTYGPGPKDERVDERWDNGGIETSLYSRQKAKLERRLDEIEREHPELRVVRMRPALIFRREAASDIHRLFLGPLVPRFLFDRRVLKLVPQNPRLRFQCVHGLDVADAFVRALHRDVRGAYNIAAEPVIDAQRLGAILDARPVALPGGVMRGALAAAWRMRLMPSEPGWIDLALETPLIACDRAHEELGWWPRVTAEEALLELIDGLHDGAGIATPPMAPRAGAPERPRLRAVPPAV